MSEKEQNERVRYRQWRRKGILVQLAVILILAALTAGLFFWYSHANQARYVSYKDGCDLGYRVFLKDNAFYAEESLDENFAYVAEMIDHIEADLLYDLDIHADGVRYEYQYFLDATLEICDKDSGKAVYSPSYLLKDTVKEAFAGKKLSVRDTVSIDYGMYNDIAKDYIDTYELRNITSTLVVRAHVSVRALCASFAETHAKDYVTELRIPLSKNLIRFETFSDAPQTENKILANNGAKTDTLRIFLWVFAFITAALLIALFLFIRVTRNKYIEYTAKVQRLVSSYRSYIQKVTSYFDPNGYQILRVDSFGALLTMRDTLQSPILMLENEDKTATSFIIPAPNMLLYLYEIEEEP